MEGWRLTDGTCGGSACNSGKTSSLEWVSKAYASMLEIAYCEQQSSEQRLDYRTIWYWYHARIRASQLAQMTFLLQSENRGVSDYIPGDSHSGSPYSSL